MQRERDCVPRPKSPIRTLKSFGSTEEPMLMNMLAGLRGRTARYNNNNNNNRAPRNEYKIK